MVKAFYIAISFEDAELMNTLTNELEISEFQRTYDWTKNKRASSLEEL